jgi:SAM-dependent methyltransferase
MRTTQPTPSWPASDLEACPACPACHAAARAPWFTDLADRLYGCACGLWTFQRCARCGAAYLDPRPTRETIGGAYNDYYTHASSPPAASESSSPAQNWRRALRHGYLNRRYGLSLARPSPLGPLLVPLVPGLASRHRRWARLPRPHEAASLLDVGAGSGGAVAHFRALGWDAVGVDVDPAAVAAARASDLPVTEEEITALAGSDRFDAITMSHSLEHLHDPAAALAAARRLLKPAGVLELITPNANSLGRRVYARDWLGLDPPRHLVVFTPRAITRALHDAGFQRIGFHRPLRPPAWYFHASEALRQGRPWTDVTTPTAFARAALLLSNVSAATLPRLGEELVVTAFKPGDARRGATGRTTPGSELPFAGR